MARSGGRAIDALRPVRLTTGYLDHAEGSVLVEFGRTRVLCAVSIEDRVPPFRFGKGGWLTAEYGMLPRATHTRSQREAATGRQGGRTFEIQRLIGRSLRAVVDLSQLGERTVLIDCDVLQADAGTRTAGITGAFVALVLALRTLPPSVLPEWPIRDSVAAVSVGILAGVPMLDLDYDEDSSADVDFNVVMTGDGRFVEVQGTAEGEPFDRDQMNRLVELAADGIRQLQTLQRDALGGTIGRVKSEE